MVSGTDPWRQQTLLLLVGGLFTLLVGCRLIGESGKTGDFGRFSSAPRRLGCCAELVDRDADFELDSQLVLDELKYTADRLRHLPLKPKSGERPQEILVLSGGGMFGAFSAGVLVGWTDAGTRPTFDVVTGISTGALIATLAFLGPAYDEELRRQYTSVSDSDLFIRRGTLRGLFAESLADNSPLVRRIRAVITPEFLQATATEHQKGRRLYVGTTNLVSRRLVVWDLGAIASQGTPEARDLFCDVLVASAAVPGFFPPVRLKIDIEGCECEELHVDGGATRSMFFRPPYRPTPTTTGRSGEHVPLDLNGANLYVLVAGKIYADPEVPRPRTLSVASHALTSLVYAQTRGDLKRLYTRSLLSGMNYYVASLPSEVQVPTDSMRFDPVIMTRLFNEGYRQAQRPFTQLWKDRPVLDWAEEVRSRSSLRLARPSQPGVK